MGETGRYIQIITAGIPVLILNLEVACQFPEPAEGLHS